MTRAAPAPSGVQGTIAADCREGKCFWRHRSDNSLAGLREMIEAIRYHCITRHKGSCREVSVVIHAPGEGCDHEHAA